MTGLTVGTIMLGVTDLESSIAFYRDRLGLALQNQSNAFAFFDAGPVTLCLSRPHAESRSPVAGACEVVFAVDDVRNAHAALLHRGVTFLHPPRAVTGDQWAANFQDPDGHLLSIFGPERKA